MAKTKHTGDGNYWQPRCYVDKEWRKRLRYVVALFPIGTTEGEVVKLAIERLVTDVLQSGNVEIATERARRMKAGEL